MSHTEEKSNSIPFCYNQAHHNVYSDKHADMIDRFNTCHTDHSFDTDLSNALDFCSTPMLFINDKFTIKHINFRGLSFFKKHHETFKMLDPCFNVDLLVDYQLIYFQMATKDHYNAIMNMKLGDCVVVCLDVEQLHLELRFTPIFSKQYQRVGTCIEIYDHTQEINSIQQLDLAITEASKGNFSYQIDTEIFEANVMFRLVFNKINELFNHMSSFFGDIAVALEHLVGGQLIYSLETRNKAQAEHEKDLVDLTKQDINYTLKQMAIFVQSAKIFSGTTSDVINGILSNNSELAMTTENEETMRRGMVQKLDEVMTKLQINRSEIEQAIEVANSVKNNEHGIIQIKTLFSQVGEQLKTAFDIMKFLEYILRTHLQSLKDGIHQVEIGNIGRGIHMISRECESMVSKTADTLLQVQDSMKHINQAFSFSNSSVDNILNSVGDSMDNMVQVIDLMSLIMDELQKSMSTEDQFFTEIKDFIHHMHQMRVQTFNSIEKTVVSVSTLAYVNQQLENLLNTFDCDDDNIISPLILNKNREFLQKIQEHYRQIQEITEHQQQEQLNLEQSESNEHQSLDLIDSDFILNNIDVSTETEEPQTQVFIQLWEN